MPRPLTLSETESLIAGWTEARDELTAILESEREAGREPDEELHSIWVDYCVAIGWLSVWLTRCPAA